MRNSLAIVRGAARLLRSPGVDPSVTGLLIERHAGQMSRHIEDLLQPLRRNGASQGLQLSRVDLRVLARYAADSMQTEMARRGHHLAVQLPAEPVWAQADGARLEQVFANLLINAAKYTANGGDIAFSMDRAGDEVRVRVRDTGIGIEPAMLPRVFGLFVQVGTGPPDTFGTRGIGLAVVRNLVERHGGTVWAKSEGLGHGSEFTVLLPALSEPAHPLIVAP
jgi:signal transduction histidine kinase